MDLEFMRCHSEREYFESLVALLPRGSWWDKELANANSDLLRELRLLAASVKAENDSISNTLREAFAHLAGDCLADWERLCALDGRGKTAAQRRSALRRHRAGNLNSRATLESVVGDYQMRLARIEHPQRPFRMGHTIKQPLYEGFRGNVVRFVIEPQNVKVRPAIAASARTAGDVVTKPLCGPDYNIWAPGAPKALENDLQRQLALPQIAQLRYL